MICSYRVAAEAVMDESRASQGPMHLTSSTRIMLAARAGSCYGRHSPSFFRYGG
jgi:hypothetical protein